MRVTLPWRSLIDTSILPLGKRVMGCGSCGIKAGRSLGRTGRKFIVGAVAQVGNIVIQPHYNRAVRKLCLKMERIAIEGADDRPPIAAVGMDAPQAPLKRAAQPLVLKAAEHDPPILEHDRMQGRAEVQMADLFDVVAVLVHDKQLQSGTIHPPLAARARCDCW